MLLNLSVLFHKTQSWRKLTVAWRLSYQPSSVALPRPPLVWDANYLDLLFAVFLSAPPPTSVSPLWPWLPKEFDSSSVGTSLCDICARFARRSSCIIWNSKSTLVSPIPNWWDCKRTIQRIEPFVFTDIFLRAAQEYALSTLIISRTHLNIGDWLEKRTNSRFAYLLSSSRKSSEEIGILICIFLLRPRSAASSSSSWTLVVDMGRE